MTKGKLFPQDLKWLTSKGQCSAYLRVYFTKIPVFDNLELAGSEIEFCVVKACGLDLILGTLEK